MKLIIQNIDGVLYAYRETEKHHRKVEKERGTISIDPILLDFEAELGQSLLPGQHFVFGIK